MATLTFTNDAGEVQTFDLGVLNTSAPAEVIADVEVQNTDGTSEELVPEAAA